MREYWIGWPDGENPVVLENNEVDLKDPQGAKIFREVNTEMDLIIRDAFEFIVLDVDCSCGGINVKDKWERTRVCGRCDIIERYDRVKK